MSRRRVLLMTLTHALPPGGGAGGQVAAAFSSDRVAFAVPAGLGVELPFQARISGQDDVVIERSASVWTFDRAPAQKAGTISLLNGDRALDSLLAHSWRDAQYELRWCWDDEAADPGHSYAACTLWQAGVIDSMSTTDGDRRIVFALADPLAFLDKPLQADLWPDDCPNEAIRGKPKPLTLGLARFVPGVLVDTRTIQSVGPPAVMWPDAYSFDVHSDPVHSISAAYDRGDIFAYPADWEYRSGRTGVKLKNRPDRPISMTVQGAMLEDGAGTTWDFKSGPWSGGMPVGWNISNGSVTQVTGGARLTSSTQAQLYSLTSLSAGVHWLINVEIDARTSGDLRTRLGTDVLLPKIDNAGVHLRVASLSGSARVPNMLTSASGSTDITITSIRATPVTTTDRIKPFIQWVVDRAAEGTHYSPTIDTAAVDALANAADYQVGTHEAGPVTALTVLRRLLDGWCGWVTSTRDGQLTVGRLRKRGGTTGTVRLGRGQIITVRRRTDTAPGLATRLAGLRTHHVHSDSDIATSVDDALRAELQAEYTVKTGSTPMPTAYAHADGADPQPTLLQDAAQLQAAADHVTDLFGSGPMTWYELEAAISSEIADGLEMGDWIHVTHPVAGLDAGKWLCLMGATIRFRGRRTTLTLLDIPE